MRQFGIKPITTNGSLSRAPICGATKTAVGKCPDGESAFVCQQEESVRYAAVKLAEGAKNRKVVGSIPEAVFEEFN